AIVIVMIVLFIHLMSLGAFLDSEGFFFSSRRRHTRFSRDWSSDVCSSDLAPLAPSLWDKWVSGGGNCRLLSQAMSEHGVSEGEEIGRASCRERVEIVEVDCEFSKRL